MGPQVSYPHFNQRSLDLPFYFAGVWTLLQSFSLQVTENSTHTCLSIRDNLFSYIIKKSEVSWLQVQLDQAC